MLRTHSEPRRGQMSHICDISALRVNYGKYLPNLSFLAPVYELLKKYSKRTWKYTQVPAFNSDKSLLQSAPVFVHYDNAKELVLACDASPYRVGAVLSHCLEDGTK